MMRGYFWMMFGFGLEFITPMLLLVLITNRFSEEQAGAWIVFITILFTATKFREGVTQNALVTFSAGRNRQDRWSVYHAMLLISAGIEGVISLGIWTAGNMMAASTLAELLRLYPVLAMAQLLFRWIRAILTTELRSGAVTVLNAILLGLVGCSLLLFSHRLTDIIHFLNLMAAAYACSALIAIPFIGIQWAWNRAYLAVIYRDLVRFGANGLLRELLGTLSSRAYLFLSAGFVGMAASAHLGIAGRYANVIYLPNSAWQAMLYPKASEMAASGGDQSGLISFFNKNLARLFALFIPFSIGMLGLYGIAVPWVHGPEYSASIPYFTILLVGGAFISPIGHAFGSLMHSLGRPEAVTKLVTINSVVNLILSLLAVRWFGIYGALVTPILVDLIGIFWIRHMLQSSHSPSILDAYRQTGRQSLLLTKLALRTLNT